MNGNRIKAITHGRIRLDRQTLARVSKAIDSLSENPRPAGCLKVITSEGRVADSSGRLANRL